MHICAARPRFNDTRGETGPLIRIQSSMSFYLVVPIFDNIRRFVDPLLLTMEYKRHFFMPVYYWNLWTTVISYKVFIIT